jgi:hypothetical protein
MLCESLIWQFDDCFIRLAISLLIQLTVVEISMPLSVYHYERLLSPRDLPLEYITIYQLMLEEGSGYLPAKKS